jgi:hypothetical protein
MTVRTFSGCFCYDEHMNRPTKLFHASPLTDILEFEPRNEYPRYTGEANLVFATRHEELAAMFLSPRNINTEIGIYDNEYIIFINADEATYAEQDQGGAIYSLPVETFETDTDNGMREDEWYSKSPVKPINKTVYKTSIEAMKMFNVKRYFVDDDTFQKIRSDPANALKLIK